MFGRVLVCVIWCLLMAMVPVLAAPNEDSLVVKEDSASSPIPAAKFAVAFDGGPSREYTPKVLEIMNRYGARGTFFPADKNTAPDSETIRQMKASGHEIGIHSIDRLNVAQLPYTTFYEISPMAVVEEIAGTPSRYSSPLYREGNVVYTRQVPELGVTVVYWLLDPRDLSDVPAPVIAERVLANLKPGAIVVLHDGVGSRQATVEALEMILREAAARGYQSVTLSELEDSARRDYFSSTSKTWLSEDQAEVRNIQARLEELGYDCGGVDGILGPATDRGIRGLMQGRRVADEVSRPVVKVARPEIRINIPEYSLSLLDNGKVIRRFDIAVGTPYEQTPTGKYAIFAKIENPTWYPGSNFTDRTPVPPGADNPLGTRWMEFSPAYGIHGTNKDWDISYPVSGGCIRMHDAEARELYELVTIGTPVTVVYETLQVTVKPDGLYLKVLPDVYNRLTSSREQFDELYRPFGGSGYKLIKPVILPPKELDEGYELKVAVKSGI